MDHKTQTIDGWLNELELLKGNISEPTQILLRDVLVNRYGSVEKDLIERIDCYHSLMKVAKNVHTLGVSPGFDITKKVLVSASPGRNRLFMGHSDFAGLGGFTIDAATDAELLIVGQETQDGMIWLHNTSPDYEDSGFKVEDVLQAVQDPTAYGKRIWETTNWTSYVKGALGYTLCPRFKESDRIKNSFSTGKGAVFVISSQGELALSAAGGQSSSAALTGGLMVCLNEMFQWNLSLDQLAQTDYGEYFLGKMAGCADKMAQLNAHRNKVSVIQAVPEKLLKQIVFPSQIKVMLADCPTPRLTTQRGSKWLKNMFQDTDHSTRISNWATAVMFRFGSLAYVKSIEVLAKRLRDIISSDSDDHFVSKAESQVILNALHYNQDDRQYKGGLLRELCENGALETTDCGNAELTRGYRGIENRHNRYALLYKMLKLLPEQYQYEYTNNLGKTVRSVLCLRKAALYGLSEVERGYEYLRVLDQISAAPPDQLDVWRKQLINLVMLSQDADKSIHDYRILKDSSEVKEEQEEKIPNPYTDCKSTIVNTINSTATTTTTTNTTGTDSLQDGSSGVIDLYPHFPRAPWYSNPRSDVSDASIDQWIQGQALLVDCVGGFERSLPEIDDMADELHRVFQGKAALRVSAAGMGGRVCIHAFTELVDDVSHYLEGKGWTVSKSLQPGHATQIIRC